MAQTSGSRSLPPQVDYFLRAAKDYKITSRVSATLNRIVTEDVVNCDSIVVDSYVGNRGLIILCDVIRRFATGCRVIAMTDANLYHGDNEPGSVAGNMAIRAMCAVLAGHPALEVWDLSRNEIGVAALQHLVAFAKATPTLIDIVLRDTLLVEEDLWQLRAVLDVNRRRQEKRGALVGDRSVRLLEAKVSSTVSSQFLGQCASLVMSQREMSTILTSPTQRSSPASPSRGRETKDILYYQQSKKVPQLLSAVTMQHIVQRTTAHEVSKQNAKGLSLPVPLTNIELVASTDGKAKPRNVKMLMAASWRRWETKSHEELESVKAALRRTNVYQAARLQLFPEPPLLADDEVKNNIPESVAVTTTAESDRAEITAAQRAQEDTWLHAIAEMVSRTSFRPGELIWEEGDIARCVYLIDPLGGAPMDTLACITKHGVDASAQFTTKASKSELHATTTAMTTTVGLEEALNRSSTALSTACECSMPIGQFFGYDDPTATHGPSPTRKNSCFLLSTTALTADGSNDDGAAAPTVSIPVLYLRREVFDMYFYDPLLRSRYPWKRLVDSMPSTLGLDAHVRHMLADVLISTTVFERDLPGGIVSADSVAFPIDVMRRHVVLVDEGNFTVKRKRVEMRTFSRGDVIYVSPEAQDIDELQVLFLSGNMPAWKYCMISIQAIRETLPQEIFQSFTERCAKTFAEPELQREGMMASWKRRK